MLSELREVSFGCINTATLPNCVGTWWENQCVLSVLICNKLPYMAVHLVTVSKYYWRDLKLNRHRQIPKPFH